VTSDVLERTLSLAPPRRSWWARIIEVTEQVRQHVGMSAGSWISFGGLLFVVMVQTAVIAYWGGVHSATQDEQAREISTLREEVKQIPVLLLRIEQAEKAASDAKAETRLKEYNEQQEELREAAGGYMAIHGKGKK
jgi:hypothetical protein